MARYAKAVRVDIKTREHVSHQKTTEDPKTNMERKPKETMESVNQCWKESNSLNAICARIKILSIWSWKLDHILLSTFAVLQCFSTSKLGLNFDQGGLFEWDSNLG